MNAYNPQFHSIFCPFMHIAFFFSFATMSAEYSLSQLSFLAAVLVTGFLTVRVIIPPNHTPKDRVWGNDSLRFVSDAVFLNLAVSAVAGLILYYAVLCASPSPAAICPTEALGQRNVSLFTWSPVTAASFAAILLGAWIRMDAFSNLGKNFTFGLAKPSGLITDGVHAYMQHPSYTGMTLVAVGAAFTSLRYDSALACFVPPAYWPLVKTWGATVYIGAFLLLVVQLRVRVEEEEAMLKELFGKEWEEWHAKTKRFIPGVF